MGSVGLHHRPWRAALILAAVWLLILVLLAFGSGARTVAGAATVPRFTWPAIVPDAGADPSALVSGDLNGDGKQDLAIADSSSASVSVLFGRGDGNFRRPVAIRTARNPVDVAIADLNGDAHPDLVTASSGRAGAVSVLLNDGAGGFRRASMYPTAPHASAVAVGDLNGDGLIDAVTAHDASHGTQLTVLLGSGAGVLRVAHQYPGAGAVDVALGDLNGDGRLDTVLALPDRDRLIVRLGAGDGSLEPVEHYPTDYPLGLALADFDENGTLDVTAADFDAGLSVFSGVGDGTLRRATARYLGGVFGTSGVVAADFDGDGNPDIASASDPPTLLRGHGDGTFGRPRRLHQYPGYQDGSYVLDTGVAADFDGDGRPDLAFTESCDHAPCPGYFDVYLNWTGSRAQPCLVVDITDTTRRQATRTLRAAGCRLRHVVRRASRSVPKGKIISQRPADDYGRFRPPRTPVDVVVSRGRHR